MKRYLIVLTLIRFAFGATIHVRDSGSNSISEACRVCANGDTILLHCSVFSTVTITDRILYFRAIDTLPRIVWSGDIPGQHAALICKNSAVRIRNISFRGADGSPGTSYCGTNACGSCSEGGDGGQGLILDTSRAEIENCSFTGGNPGKGGKKSSKACYDCECYPCGMCADGKIGVGLMLTNGSRADTHNVVLSSVFVDSTSAMRPYFTGIRIDVPSRFLGGNATADFSLEIYDLRGRKLGRNLSSFGKGADVPARVVVLAKRGRLTENILIFIPYAVRPRR